jgi:hypothetical protein
MPFILRNKSASKFYLKTNFTLLLAILTLSTPINGAFAEENSSRYTMIESKNGIIRLDKKTGAMSNCKKSTNGWSCRQIKETSGADKLANQDNNDQFFSELQKANEELEKENQILKQKIANLELGIKNDPTDKKLKLPTDEEVDEAITYMEKMIRKFGGAMKRLQEKNSRVPGTEL